MKIPRALVVTFALGLAIGYWWQPYTFTTQRLGDVQAVIKHNRFTGNSWQLMPGGKTWDTLDTPKPKREPTKAIDWIWDWIWALPIAAAVVLWITWENGYRSGLRATRDNKPAGEQ